jgi:hypothetical protein
MTEEEWLASCFPEALVSFLANQVSQRKLRLFACACCRKADHLLKDPRSIHAVRVAEDYADGVVSENEVRSALSEATQARDEARGVGMQEATAAAIDTLHPSATLAGRRAWWSVARAEIEWRFAFQTRERRRTAEAAIYQEEQRRQSGLLRCIVGNPFRPVAFNPAWRTDTALSLARQMYDSRDFGAMPILADALQDAGCEHEQILNHCRDANQSHVRGCWVVDLVLGKE